MEELLALKCDVRPACQPLRSVPRPTNARRGRRSGGQPVAGNPDCTGPVLESSTITHRVDSIHLDLLLNQLQLPGNLVRRVECPGPAPDLVPTWALRSLDLD